jgi:hypothetical protein
LIRQRKKKESSFLKKRSKKLLSVSGSTGAPHVPPRLRAMSKSLLLLFFRKEDSSFL